MATKSKFTVSHKLNRYLRIIGAGVVLAMSVAMLAGCASAPKPVIVGIQISASSDVNPDLHDIAIIVIGEKPYAEGLGDIRSGDHVIVEAGSQIKGSMNVLEPYGNTLELARLHPEDLQTIKTISPPFSQY